MREKEHKTKGSLLPLYVATRIVVALLTPFLYATLVQRFGFGLKVVCGTALSWYSVCMVLTLVNLLARRRWLRITQAIGCAGLLVALALLVFAGPTPLRPLLVAGLCALGVVELLWLGYAFFSPRIAQRVARIESK